MIFNLLILVIIVVFGSIIRIPFYNENVYSLQTKGAAGDDSGFISKVIDQKFNFLTTNGQNSIIKGDYGYPPFFHWLISKFHKRIYRRVAVCFNIFFDVSISVFIYFYSYNKIGIEKSFLLSLIFLTLPNLIDLQRLTSINGRQLGFFLINIFLILLFNYNIGNFYYYNLGGIFLILFLLVISSRFALQFYLFFVLIFSIFFYDPLFLISIFFLLLITRIKKINIYLTFWIEFLKFYKHINKFMTTNKKNLFKSLNNNFFKEIFLYLYPLLFLFIFCFMQDSNVDDKLKLFTKDNYVQIYFFSIIVTLLAYILSSFKHLNFLGEADRYFQFTLLPLVLIIVFFLEFFKVGTLPLIMIFIINILFYINKLNYLIKIDCTPRELVVSKEKLLLNFLVQKGIKKICAVPIQSNGLFEGLSKSNNYKIKFLILYMLKKSSNFKYIKNFFANTNFQIPNILYLNQKYKIRYFIISKKFVKYGRFNLQDIMCNLKYKKIYSNQEYLVLKI